MANNSSDYCPVYIGCSPLKWWPVVITTNAAISTILNLIVVLAILRFKALRSTKEYTMIGFLAFADFLNGLGGALGHGWRTYLVYTDSVCSCIDAITCMMFPYNPLWRWCDYAQTGMLLAISTDRLYALFAPASYYKCKRGYALKVCSGVYLYATVFLTFGYIKPIMDPYKQVALVCLPAQFIGTFYLQVCKYVSSTQSFLSVFAYVVVWIKFKKTVKVSSKEDDPAAVLHRKRQRRLTITLGISSLCTFILDVLPRGIGVYWQVRPTTFMIGPLTPADILFNLDKWNANANFLIYAARHVEMRRAVKALIFCQKMPENLQLWDTQAVTHIQSNAKSSKAAPNSTIVHN